MVSKKFRSAWSWRNVDFSSFGPLYGPSIRFLEAVWIKDGKTIGGGHPINSAPCFQDIGNVVIGQSLLGIIVTKNIAIEARKPSGSAEPHEAVRVLEDAINRIVG